MNRTRSYITAICCLGAAALVGCGPIYYIPLKPEHASAIGSTRVYATITQEEVNAAVKVSNTPITNAGLVSAIIGAVIDTAVTSHRASEAQRLVEPIRREVTDLDFRTAFFDSLQATLPALHTLRLARLTTSKAPRTPELWQAVRARTREDTLLSLITGYEFSTDFRTFSVLTTAEIVRSGHPDPLYRGVFVYVSDPIIDHDEPADAASAWAFNRAAPLRAAMREGIDETMKMLVLDLGSAVAPAKSKAAPAAPVVTSTTARASASGSLAAPAVSTAASTSRTAAAPASPVASTSASASAAAPAASVAPTATVPTTPMVPASASASAAAPAASVAPMATAPARPVVPASASASAAASAAAAASATASPSSTAPAAAMAASSAPPAAAGSPGVLAAASAPPAATAVSAGAGSARPAAAAPASTAAASRAAPTTGGTGAAPTPRSTSATAGNAANAANAPAARPARPSREIVRRSNGIMYSAPREPEARPSHAIDPGSP